MNTHGHKSVAKDAGLDLLKTAFKQNMNNPRLDAFYLGNWIADLSQLVDPVAGATARDKIKDFVDDVFDTLYATTHRSNCIIIVERYHDSMTGG